ncbi:surface-adhesin E family protein [Geobacter sp.]|uniref:surface-adhesin E family protein n=1 Tax=Geobacter sp. TaxID=46610 RepID=UPI00262B8DE4|nr:surface-adhesin E family protein [Geobacter sp.]
MKTVCRLLLALSFVASFNAAATAAGDPWVLLDEDPMLSNYFYDRTSVKKGDDDLVTVRTKAVYTEEGKSDALDTIGHPKGFEDLSSTVFLYDINCSGDMSRLEKVTHFDSKGGTIKSYDLAGKTGWEPIEADTRMSLLRDAVCR